MSEKRPFPEEQDPNATFEYRKTVALEFIAHYLDRIDDHLESIAKTLDANGAGFPMVAKELKEVHGVMNAIHSTLRGKK